MTTNEIIQYYVGLLIYQYLSKPKAQQTIALLVAPVIANQLPLQVNNGFTVGNTTVQGVAYPGAVGAQLDILGKYAGVTRTGSDANGSPVTLNDSEFTTLIQMAIVKNNSGDSLYDIDVLLQAYFPNEVFCYDSANMQMSYLIASSIGDQALVEVMISEGLLPNPMGVELATVTYLPNLSLFGMQSYANPTPAWSPTKTYSVGQEAFGSNGIIYSSLTNGNFNNAVTDAAYWQAIVYPLNSYATYPTYKNFTWLSYADGIII